MARKLVLSSFAAQQRPWAAFSCVFAVKIPFAAVVHFAVAVVVVAVERGSAWGVDLDQLIDDLERFHDQRIVGTLDAEADEFEEAGIDYLVLVECSGIVIEFDLVARVRLAFL